jgi:hypothetical protein
LDLNDSFCNFLAGKVNFDLSAFTFFGLAHRHGIVVCTKKVHIVVRGELARFVPLPVEQPDAQYFSSARGLFFIIFSGYLLKKLSMVRV